MFKSDEVAALGIVVATPLVCAVAATYADVLWPVAVAIAVVLAIIGWRVTSA